jgi:hypothetical protein
VAAVISLIGRTAAAAGQPSSLDVPRLKRSRVAADSEDNMERRQEDRLGLEQPVTVSICGAGEFRVPGWMSNVSGRGMQVRTARELPIGAGVQLDWDNVLALGEVIYCRPVEGGQYLSGIHLEHTLTNLEELTRLSEWLCDDVSQRSPLGIRR